MKKQDIKNILISIRTTENESEVNKLLGKVDLMDELSIVEAAKKVGNTEESIRKFFEQKLSEKQHQQSQEHIPINDMFTYGITRNCIHLHLLGDLHQMLATKGISKTIDTVNLQLLDALDRISALRRDDFYKFKGKDSIYMISPILLGRELKFLESMNFTTHSYRKKELNDNDFILKHPEASLATHIFGKDKNIGTASIRFDTMETKKWQDKKQQKINEFNEKGISLNNDAPSKE